MNGAPDLFGSPESAAVEARAGVKPAIRPARMIALGPDRLVRDDRCQAIGCEARAPYGFGPRIGYTTWFCGEHRPLGRWFLT